MDSYISKPKLIEHIRQIFDSSTWYRDSYRWNHPTKLINIRYFNMFHVIVNVGTRNDITVSIITQPKFVLKLRRAERELIKRKKNIDLIKMNCWLTDYIFHADYDDIKAIDEFLVSNNITEFDKSNIGGVYSHVYAFLNKEDYVKVSLKFEEVVNDEANC